MSAHGDPPDASKPARPGAGKTAAEPHGKGLAPGLGWCPYIHGVLPNDMNRSLRLGYARAQQMVRSVPSCRGLFVRLAASGSESLALTHYVALAGREQARVCVGGMVTLTTVGGRVTWLCPEFGRLDPREAALALVHEALHGAGLTESPATSSALAAREISELVERACAGDGVSEGVLLALGPRP